MSLFREPADERLSRFDHFICHVTATKPSQDIDDRWIDNLHRRRGFRNGNGYHLLIKRNGSILTNDRGFRMRPFHMGGAHVGSSGRGWNSRSFGCVLEGGLDENGRPHDTRTDMQKAMLEDVCLQFAAAHPRPDTLTWIGHRDLIKITNAPPKACPCFDFPAFVEERGILDKIVEEDALDGASPMDIRTIHSVKRGDTLWKIARQYHTTIERIRENNNLNTDMIHPGQEIEIR